MITCEKCGCSNNDGSRVRLNCREPLETDVATPSDAERYIHTVQEADEQAREQAKQNTRKTNKNLFGVAGGFVAVSVLIMVFYYVVICWPVVDKMLVGSWSRELRCDL